MTENTTEKTRNTRAVYVRNTLIGPCKMEYDHE